MELVYRHERSLYLTSMIVGGLIWLALVVATLGLALIYAVLGLLFYLVVHSGFIAHLRGNAVELSERQFPDLYRQYREACARLEVDDVPTAYLMMSEGMLNALAARFLRRDYVVLYSSVVEALRSRPAALAFYFGHELGHIRRGHLRLAWLRWPASVLPLLGAAYRRAQEYTCDQHGLAVSASREDALAALGVLASGGERLPHLNTMAFIEQQQQSAGFWMSYHELTNDYPWLCKRMAQIASASDATGAVPAAPPRHRLAWVLAVLTPRFGVGGGASILVTLALIGVLLAIAIPAYQDFSARSEVALALPLASQVQSVAGVYIEEHGEYPGTLQEIGVPESLDTGPVSSIRLLDDGIELTLRSHHAAVDAATMILSAYRTDSDGIAWDCTQGTLAGKYRPVNCRAP
ncbi:MAG: hypothetical protein FJ191_12960 [Gammaproteobacteria bacterium]|nr:hypothetical protein [Gammaproteobacteria bacterium]